MISSVMGSACRRHCALPFLIAMRRLPYSSTVTGVARMDDGRASLGLDDRGALEAHPRLEQVAVVDVGDVMALGRVVHFALSFPGFVERSPGDRKLGRRELPDLGDRDEMDADDLDRRVEAIRVLPLVGLVEVRRDLSDLLGVDRSVRQEDLDAVLLVLVAHVRVPHEAHLIALHAFGLELRERAVSVTSLRSSSSRFAFSSRSPIRRVTK